MIIILRELIELIARKNPRLELELKQAKIDERPETYISKSLAIALIFSLTLIAPLFFILIKAKVSLLFLLGVFIIFFPLILMIILNLPSYRIKKRINEIESDILYSARYLLLKMRTGAPLINALVDVSKLHTNSSKYFGEIVSDIYLGEPIENAIEHAYRYTPSEQFKKILKVVKNSLNTGVDIKSNMELVLKEITDEQIIKIESYSKKINSLSLFYMVLGVIAPSLGVSMFIIAASFIKIKVTMGLLLFLFVLICIIQYFFIMLFNAAKPKVSL